MKTWTTTTVSIALCGATLLGATIGSFYGWDDAIRGGGIGVASVAILWAAFRAFTWGIDS